MEPMIRPIEVVPNFVRNPDGSVLYSSGRTRIICSASVESGAPLWLSERRGWLTAEYSMLPYSTRPRVNRDRENIPGRTREIQRLIGRSLRASLDLSRMPGYTIKVDCDVIEADGGTRTASISGASIAVGLAIQKAMGDGRFAQDPRLGLVVAISVGIVRGTNQLDLNYARDRDADLDLNVVGTPGGDLVEIQGSSESTPIATERWLELIDLARKGLVMVGESVSEYVPAIEE